MSANAYREPVVCGNVDCEPVPTPLPLRGFTVRLGDAHEARPQRVVDVLGEAIRERWPGHAFTLNTDPLRDSMIVSADYAGVLAHRRIPTCRLRSAQDAGRAMYDAARECVGEIDSILGVL